MNLAEFHERVCEPPLAQGEEKVRVTAVLLCFDERNQQEQNSQSKSRTPALLVPLLQH